MLLINHADNEVHYMPAMRKADADNPFVYACALQIAETMNAPCDAENARF